MLKQRLSSEMATKLGLFLKDIYTLTYKCFFSASTLFQRELRWLIEKVHPINRTSSAETFQDDSNILKTRKAFAAAERAIGKTVGKRSSLGRDFLKRVTSLIKEKEDSSIKSSGNIKLPVFKSFSTEVDHIHSYNARLVSKSSYYLSKA